MIAHKKKGNVIEIYTQSVDEIESFTLLKLNDEETKMLLDASSSWTQVNNILKTIYQIDDPVNKVFNLIACRHKESNINFFEVNKKYNSKVSGTSVLIRDPEKHIIRIAKRRNTLCDINTLCIDDSTRNKFFNDVNKCSYLYKYNKYAIDITDLETYRKWSTHMNNNYQIQLNRV